MHPGPALPDDKVVYLFVPEMISGSLLERRNRSSTTYRRICGELGNEDREYVLAHLRRTSSVKAGRRIRWFTGFWDRAHASEKERGLSLLKRSSRTRVTTSAHRRSNFRESPRGRDTLEGRHVDCVRHILCEDPTTVWGCCPGD